MEEMIIVAGGAIKVIIDVIAQAIPEDKRKYIPLLALALGVAWSIFLIGGDLANAIITGVAIGASAIGVNEFTTLGKKKE